jgi:hypothetical protein
MGFWHTGVISPVALDFGEEGWKIKSIEDISLNVLKTVIKSSCGEMEKRYKTEK